MSERWERELRKLRNVDRPSTLEDRVAEGPNPHHEPGRPTRERVAAGVVAFAVIAAVTFVGYRTLSNDDGSSGKGSQVASGVPTGDAPLVLDARSGNNGPTATLSSGDLTQPGVIETSNWCPDGTTGAACSSSIADFAMYPPVTEYLVVAPATPIQFTGDGTVSKLDFQKVCDVHIPGGSCEPGTSVGELTPDEDGRYALQLNATWPQGDATIWFGVQVLSSESAAPDVLTVDCSLGFAQTDTSIVRTQPNGVAIQVVSDGPNDIVVRDDQNQVSLRDASSNGGWGLAPGRYTVGCGHDPSPDSMVPFELVDPDDHYAPWDLTCGDLPGTQVLSSVPTSVSSDEAAAQIVAGLQDGDRLRGAGYGAQTWKLGQTYVVEREGRSVARLVIVEQVDPTTGADVWGGTLAACDGSGIMFADDATALTPRPLPTPISTGATGATSSIVPAADPEPPTVLDVRCEGLGPVVDATEVRLQDDGLHIDAENIADADFVIVEGSDGVGRAVQDFDKATMPLVFDIEPGTYWIGCRVYDENGQITGSHLDHPQAYVQIDVLPADT